MQVATALRGYRLRAKQYEAAKSTVYPRFDAELGRTADNNIDGTAGHKNEWQAMLRMNFNLYACGSNETFTAQRRLLEVKNIQLFTRYRIKATIGHLLKNQGVVVPMATVVQNDMKPRVDLPGMNRGSPDLLTARMKRAPRGI